jgi:hypothetical protein
VASQNLDSVRDKFNLHEFSHVGKELLKICKQTSSALSTILLKPADIPEFVKDLPDVLPLAKGNNIRQREQINPSVLDQDKCGVEMGKNDNAGHELLQPNVNFASLKKQSLFYDDIPDDDPIYYHDMEVGQEAQKNWRMRTKF